MHLSTLAPGVLTLDNREIETSVQKLVFRFLTLNADVPASAGNVRDKAIADFAAICGGTVVNLVMQGESINETLIPRLLLKDIGELSSFNDGVVLIEKNTALTHHVCEFSVELALESAILLGDKTKLILSLDNKPTASTLNIEGVDLPYVDRKLIQYENKYVQANVAKDFDVPFHYALSIPGANFGTLDMHFSNGRKVTYTKDEMRQNLVDEQEVIFSYHNQDVKGIGAWYTTSLVDVVRISITPVIAGNIVLTKELSF